MKKAPKTEKSEGVWKPKGIHTPFMSLLHVDIIIEGIEYPRPEPLPIRIAIAAMLQKLDRLVPVLNESIVHLAANGWDFYERVDDLSLPLAECIGEFLYLGNIRCPA